MRILIIGAGVAGTALAAMLEYRGHDLKIIERSTDFSKSGYALSLWPLGSRILIGLNAIEPFRKIAQPLETYHMKNGVGELISAYDLRALITPHGDTGTLSRKDLLEILRSRLKETSINMGCSVSKIEHESSETKVTFDDGSVGLFDLVVGADGIHSHTRQLIAGEIPLHETGWGGWVWWAPLGTIPVSDVTEYWGGGRFLGLYPTHDQICVFAGGPINKISNEISGRKQHVLDHFAALTPALPTVFDALPNDDQDIFFWKLDDVRSPIWSKGRVVLLGDAATAFLPTAGVGASMALESAAVLADELLRVEAKTLPRALALYEARHRKRVERAQSDSRHLAQAMLINSAPIAMARDMLLKHYSVENFVASIMKSLNEPI